MTPTPDAAEIEALIARIPKGYTPGPWCEVAYNDGDDVHICRDGDEGPEGSIFEGGPTLSDEATNAANCRLIALAPEMAAALRSLSRPVEVTDAMVKRALKSWFGPGWDAEADPVVDRERTLRLRSVYRVDMRAALTAALGGRDNG